MIDQLVVESSKPFLDLGIVGALCIILALVIVWQNRTHRAEMKDERLSHQKTREAHIEALKATLALGESMRASQVALDTTIEQFIDLSKEVLRERGKA